QRLAARTRHRHPPARHVPGMRPTRPGHHRDPARPRTEHPMTITIPTRDLIGASKDALLYTAPAKDWPELARVRYEWDGETLHISATNVLTGCHARWIPEQTGEDWPGVQWGGADDPWAVVIDAESVKHLVKSLDVPGKLSGVPLTIDVDQAVMTVRRSRDTGLPAVQNRYTGSLDEFPDVEKQIANLGDPAPAAVLAFDWPGGTAASRVSK